MLRQLNSSSCCHSPAAMSPTTHHSRRVSSGRLLTAAMLPSPASLLLLCALCRANEPPEPRYSQSLSRGGRGACAGRFPEARRRPDTHGHGAVMVSDRGCGARLDLARASTAEHGQQQLIARRWTSWRGMRARVQGVARRGGRDGRRVGARQGQGQGHGNGLLVHTHPTHKQDVHTVGRGTDAELPHAYTQAYSTI